MRKDRIHLAEQLDDRLESKGYAYHGIYNSFVCLATSSFPFLCFIHFLLLFPTILSRKSKIKWIVNKSEKKRQVPCNSDI